MKPLFAFFLLIYSTAAFAAEDAKPIYENNFENAEVGSLPDGFLALEGEFTVKQDGTNKFLELPGTPLDYFSVQFGPVGTEDIAVKARIFGMPKGRRYPTFGVALGGVSGYRLQVTPGKHALEIYRDADLKVSIAHEWQPAEWLMLRLDLRKVSDGKWRLEGKAWQAGTPEPTSPMIQLIATDAPPAGRSSVFGSPFSGTPIWFDDLVVEKAKGGQQ